jgi:hypothetical protein
VQEVHPFSPSEAREKAGILSSDQKRALVQRVIDSQIFARSPAMRAFLLYVTEQAIAGRADDLKEQIIGTQVLGRKPNYDPADDNIVRVRAHELRGRLDRYFSSEGAGEPVTITIPRGAYAPEFVPRKTAVDEPSVAPEIAGTALETREPHRPGGLRWPIVAVLVLLAICASVILTRLALKTDTPTDAAKPAGSIRAFWGQFFDRPNEELKVVYSDTSFALWQDLSGQTLNLGEYLNHKYLNVNDDKFFNVASRRVTSPADIAISARLGVLAGEFGGQVSPRFARDASAEFLRSGNTVLIGSHRSDPWVEVFEPNLNFVLSQDPHTGAPQFINRSPRPNEAAVYAIPAMFDTQRTEEKEFNSYAVVALLKGCGNRGLTVLTEGLNTQATQAAGDIVTDPQRLDALLRSIGHKTGTNVAPFEALIQITSLPAEYDNPKVVAYRIHAVDSCVGN